MWCRSGYRPRPRAGEAGKGGLVHAGARPGPGRGRHGCGRTDERAKRTGRAVPHAGEWRRSAGRENGPCGRARHTIPRLPDESQPGEASRALPREEEAGETLPPFVVFDVETRRSAAEVGGWHMNSRMGVSVAVAYDSRGGIFMPLGRDRWTVCSVCCVPGRWWRASTVCILAMRCWPLRPMTCGCCPRWTC